MVQALQIVVFILAMFAPIQLTLEEMCCSLVFTNLGKSKLNMTKILFGEHQYNLGGGQCSNSGYGRLG